MYRYSDALVGGIEWKDIDWFRVDVIDTVELQLFIKHLQYSRGCKARAFIVCVPSKWMASHSVDTVPTKWEIL